MKNKLTLFIAICFLVFSVPAQEINYIDSLKTLEPKLPEYSTEAHVISTLLGKLHYNKFKFKTLDSEQVYNNYFDALDPSKIHFYQSDMDKFEGYKTKLASQIAQGELRFGYMVFDLYRRRYLQRIAYILKRIETKLDFTKKEYLMLDRSKIESYPISVEEMNKLWDKLIKSQILPYLVAGKKWEEVKSIIEKRYKRIRRNILQNNSEDVFQVYMNAYTKVFDPYTNYFVPKKAEDFNINLNLSLEGIGATLTQKTVYTVVHNVISGGPAYKSKGIVKDDKIIAVAQGDTGVFEDIIGWRLDDVISKIRGSKGTIVRLVLLKSNKPPDALPDTLRLVRDKIKLEEKAAKAEIFPLNLGKNKYKLGVITIPSFYLDYKARNKGEEDYKSTSKDVIRLINDLKNQGMEGLLIDLRNDGGGSLDEAVDVTGLFIKNAPVVQVKYSNKHVRVLSDNDDSKIYYDGPLAVLINRLSASASEIFSGAIQDHKRGVILGETSFGKGTVQSILDINKYVNSLNFKHGQLKYTMAKFYRISGESNQRVGIVPDVLFPGIYDQEKIGESGQKNALPWDKIDKLDYIAENSVDEKLLNHLKSEYQNDLKKDENLIQLVKDIQKNREKSKENLVSLNIEERNSENKTLSDPKPEGKKDIDVKNEGKLKNKEEEMSKKLKKDVYLKEGLKLLSEVVKKTK